MEQPKEPPSREPKKQNPRIAPLFSTEVRRQSINADCLKYLGRLPDPIRHEDRSEKTIARKSHPKNPSFSISADKLNWIVCCPDSYWYEVFYLPFYSFVLNQEVSSSNLLKIPKNPYAFFDHSRPLNRLSNNTSNLLNRSVLRFRFGQTQSLFNQSIAETIEARKKWVRWSQFLRRKKVRKRHRRLGKRWKSSIDLSQENKKGREAAYTVSNRKGKKGWCVELSKSKSADCSTEYGRRFWFLSGGFRATSASDGDLTLDWGGRGFPTLQETKREGNYDGEGRVFGEWGKPIGYASRESVLLKRKEGAREEKRRKRVFGGGVVLGTYEWSANWGLTSKFRCLQERGANYQEH